MKQAKQIRKLTHRRAKTTPAKCDVCGSFVHRFVHRQSNGWEIRECGTCHLVQILPKPSQLDVARLYEHDWEHFSPYVSQTNAHREYFKKLLRFIMQSIGGETHGKRLLDVGCATGLLLEEAKSIGMTAVGIDISADAVSHCRSKGQAVINTTLAEFSKEKIPAFDIITACEVIEHEYDPITMIKSAFSLLKPSGLFVVTTPNFNTVYRSLFGSRWVGYQHPEHLWFYTPETISDAFSRAGFTTITVRSDFPRKYELSYAFRRLGEYFPAGKFLFKPLERIAHTLRLINPVNPWGDMLVIGKKTTRV